MLSWFRVNPSSYPDELMNPDVHILNNNITFRGKKNRLMYDR